MRAIAGNNDSDIKKVLKSKNCRNKLLIRGPEIIARPIEVKRTPNIVPLLVGIAKSYMVAVITGGKKDTTIPCSIRIAKSELRLDKTPKSRNEKDWMVRAKRTIRFLPIRSATVPIGSLRNMEKREGIAIRSPRLKKPKPRSSTYSGKTGEKANHPVHKKKLVPNIAYNFCSFQVTPNLLCFTQHYRTI